MHKIEDTAKIMSSKDQWRLFSNLPKYKSTPAAMNIGVIKKNELLSTHKSSIKAFFTFSAILMRQFDCATITKADLKSLSPIV